MTDMSKRTYSRRGLFRAGVVAVASVGVAGAAVAAENPGAMRLAQASDKVAQNLVQYQTTPKDGAKCSLCVNFVAPNSCAVVAGTISPDGWCVAFAPKAS
jgi:hypothetical protein